MDTMVKTTWQRLFNLRLLKKFVLALTVFYRSTFESILLGFIKAWYGNSTSNSTWRFRGLYEQPDAPLCAQWLKKYTIVLLE